MNLIKSFNFSFLKQNIRKSKGIIILSLIIVPLILSMYLVVAGIGKESPEVVPVSVIGATDLVFMYVIPFVYSVVLFGFVFKKSSTDFINSMPINRTTMFVTNTIGGIILITAIQLLSGFFTLLWGAIFSNLIIFPTAILDIMIVSWISYVFVFTVSNLAMSFSGTVQSQFVAGVLILFFIPIFLELTGSISKYNNYENRYSYAESSYNTTYDISIANGYQTTYYDTLEPIKNYTMPFKLFRYGTQYSVSSNIRMIVLSIVYFVLGLKIYQKRKMEYSEESFASQKLHILIKSLTLVPVLLFVNYINIYSESISGLVIAVILCFVYYIIFDIVAKRKVPFAVTVAAFATTVVVIQVTSICAKVMDYKKQVDIDVEDIKYVSVGRNSNTHEWYSYYYDSDDDVFDGDYFMNNSQVLNIILTGKNNYMNSDDSYDSYQFSDYYERSKEIYFNIKLKNGKTYYIRTTISSNSYSEMKSVLARDDEYVEHMQKKICSNNGVIQVGNDVVDSKTKRKIEKALKEEYNIISTNSNNINYITKSVYQNYDVKTYRIPLSNNQELLPIVAQFANKQAVENIKGYQYDVHVDVYEKNSSGSSNSFYGDTKILNFIESHFDDEFDPSQKYYILSGGLQTRSGYKTFRFYTNDTKEVDKIVSNSSTSRTYTRYYD